MTDAWFDKFTIGAAEILIPLWMPLAAGSLIAIFAKATLKSCPHPKGHAI